MTSPLSLLADVAVKLVITAMVLYTFKRSENGGDATEE